MICCAYSCTKLGLSFFSLSEFLCYAFSCHKKLFHLMNCVFLLMLKVSNAETSCVAVTLFILQGNTCEMGHNIKFLRSHGLSQWWPVMECVLRMFIMWGLVWLFVWGSLWQQGNKHFDVQNFILTSVYSWHMFSRWYTSDLRVVSIDVRAFFRCCSWTCIMA